MNSRRNHSKLLAVNSYLDLDFRLTEIDFISSESLFSFILNMIYNYIFGY